MSGPDNRLTSIEGIAYNFDEQGVVRIEQGCDTGNVADVNAVNIHPIFLRLLAEEAGLVGKPSVALVPDSVAARLCMIGDRLCRLLDDLIEDDRQPPPFRISNHMSWRA